MADQQEIREDMGHQYGKSDYESRLKFQSEGWLVSSVTDNISYNSPTGRNFVLLARQKDSNVVMNCYEPGAQDEMHCHPGSEHTFLYIEPFSTLQEEGQSSSDQGIDNQKF
jgi:hypothetical protein